MVFAMVDEMADPKENYWALSLVEKTAAKLVITKAEMSAAERAGLWDCWLVEYLGILKAEK